MITLLALCFVGQTFDEAIKYEFNPATQVLYLRGGGRTCWTLRTAERAVAKKATTTKEYKARYRSSTRQMQPTYRYRSRGVFRGRGLFRGGAGLSGGIVPGRI